jgi:uracil-DNA glycosylase
VLGQDPYPTRGEAEGLAFSVPPDVNIPGSLSNIFKELHQQPTHGSLAEWAENGKRPGKASLSELV